MPADSIVPRRRVALIFGGRSGEHSISCVSAGSVLAALDRDRYEVVPVGITPAGKWVLAPDDAAAMAIAERVLPEVDPAGDAVVLAGDPTTGGLLGLGETSPSQLLGAVDVVFPLLHGPFGEDGTIQGLLEMAGLPYVGSGVLASALAMDKAVMKIVLAAAGLPVTPCAVVLPGDDLDPADAERLGLPLFVKPARAGSSLGISKVRDLADLPAALRHARQHDPKVLVEAMVVGREVECGVLGGLGGAPAQASVPAEIEVTGGQDFYDFEAKYLDATTLTVPALLSAETTAAVQQASLRAFRALGCAGLARVDFFVLADGTLMINEVNTMPGFTPMSMFPRMWAATGMDYPELVDRLLALALEAGTGLR